MECEYFLEGPEGSLYEGGTFVFKVVYLNGYPYNCPECFMTTRFVSDRSEVMFLYSLLCALFAKFGMVDIIFLCVPRVCTIVCVQLLPLIQRDLRYFC